MHPHSSYGSSSRKQLVRPFLSSPVALFTYLLLVLSGVGVLEWVLRASVGAQATHDVEARAVLLNNHDIYGQISPKATTSYSRPALRGGALLRRQGEGSFFPQNTTSSPSTTSIFIPKEVPPSTTTTSIFIPKEVPPSTTTTSAAELPPTSTTSIFIPIEVPPSSTTTSAAELPPTSTTSIFIPIEVPPSSSTLTTPPGTTTATFIPSTTTVTTTLSTPAQITTTPITPPSTQPGTPTSLTASIVTPTTSLTVSSTIVTPQNLGSPSPSTSNPVTPIATPSSLSPQLPSSSLNSGGVSVAPSESSSSSPVAQVATSSSATAMSEQLTSTTNSLGSTTTLAINTVPSTVRTSTDQTATTQSTSLAASVSSLAIASITDTTSQTASVRNTIAVSELPTSITATDESVAVPTALAMSTCRGGFSCLFVNKNTAVPLGDGYRRLLIPVGSPTEFAATYASMIIIFLFQSFWVIIYASIRLNEPFHQLAQPRDTPPEIGLLFEFLAVSFPVDHLKASLAGNWTSWYMVTAYLVLLVLMVVPSMAAEAFSVQNLKVYCGRGLGNNDCVERFWTIAVAPVRVLQILLILVALLVFIVLVVRIYRGSALSLKKVNLALIATTLSDPHTTGLLHNIDPDAPPKATASYMRNQSWALEPSIMTEIGTEHASYILRSRHEGNTTVEEVDSEDTKQHSKRQGPPRPLLNLLIPAFIIVFLIILILFYVVNGPDDSRLTVFFGSVTFGPKFFLVSMSTILGIALGRIEDEVRILTPYRSLNTASNPQPLLMRRLHPSPLTQAFAAFKHGEWISAYLSFMTGYGVNILAMTISNIPYHPGRSVSGTIACIFASLVLLLLMAVALIAVVVWRRGNSYLATRKWPNTLADIYILMTHSRIPGIQVMKGHSQEVTEFYNEEHDKKPTVIQRTVEIDD